MIKPETAHPAFDKACHLFGIELQVAPVDPVTTLVDVDWVDRPHRRRHRGHHRLGLQLRLRDHRSRSPSCPTWRSRHGVGLHVDGCLGGFILPFGQELGYDIPVFDFRIPGVTSISADTHKYGYAFKGTSVLTFRDKALRNAQYFFLTDWSGGKYCSPGMEGSRSGGLLAATWASMVQLGREGYRRYAQAIFETAAAMQDVGAVPPRAAHPRSTRRSCSASPPTQFDIYHVNDFMRLRGWRFNGQQYPNALHMAVTRPQTQPGVAEAFAADLADAVDYAHEHTRRGSRSRGPSTAAWPAG